MNEESKKKQLKRYELIAPLLNEGLDAGERRRLRARILESGGISERTLRRYVYDYRKRGYESLLDAPRKDKGKTRSIDPAIIDAAIELREELPSRSIRRIIEILEGEKRIMPGTVARTSLSRHLVARGYGAKHLRAVRNMGRPGSRFARGHRNSLWQADVKYGPFILEAGKKKRTYLLAIIDDATRAVMHAEFYGGQRLPILEDAFRKALLKYGKPSDILVDNGKIFISKWFRRACGRLGIRHIAAKPYSPKTKGKVEKFNQDVDRFMRELSLEPAKTLVELNRKYAVWLEEAYMNKPHAALTREERDIGGTLLRKQERTPRAAYTEDPAKVKYVSGIECREAFLWEETRTVDKSGCVSLQGLVFDVGVGLARTKADIRYDPFDTSVIEVWQGGKFVRKAEVLTIADRTPRRGLAALPPKAGVGKATHSRLLRVYEERNAKRDLGRNGALSFRGAEEKGDAGCD
jgi:transposase InsO family protein